MMRPGFGAWFLANLATSLLGIQLLAVVAGVLQSSRATSSDLQQTQRA